jgi:methionyl-tRNA synthetase
LGCEAFVQDDDLVEGQCPAHPGLLEEVRERNWFFRLSRYQERLLQALTSHELRILPAEREREVLSFVQGGLLDFSVSRDRSRSRDWGITVPGDPTQVVYVWFDALANYLALLGFPEQTPRLARFWGPDSAREHLIGKDILRFHAVYWPAILASAGLSLPSSVRVHGFVTLEGNKIGKSLGNSVDAFALIERFGSSAVRYYFLRHLHTTKDSDFRVDKLAEAHDAELAGKLGNLLQRVSALGLRHPALAKRPSSRQRRRRQPARRRRPSGTRRAGCRRRLCVAARARLHLRARQRSQPLCRHARALDVVAPSRGCQNAAGLGGPPGTTGSRAVALAGSPSRRRDSARTFLARGGARNRETPRGTDRRAR